MDVRSAIEKLKEIISSDISPQFFGILSLFGILFGIILGIIIRIAVLSISTVLNIIIALTPIMLLIAYLMKKKKRG